MNGLAPGALLTVDHDCHALAEPNAWRENGGIVQLDAGTRLVLDGVASVWVRTPDGERVEVRVGDLRKIHSD